MQYKKQAIRDRILEAGKQEYMEKGYRNGNISSIAKRAGVPVGNLYRYFEGKSGLLDAIVGPAYTEVLKTIKNLAQYDDNMQDSALEDMTPFFIENLLILFGTYKTEIMILADKCQMTGYEDFMDQITEVVDSVVTYKLFPNNTEQDRMLSKIISKSLILSLIDILHKDIPQEEMAEMLGKVIIFYFKDIEQRLDFS